MGPSALTYSFCLENVKEEISFNMLDRLFYSCRRHTLAYAPNSGRLYAFGLGASGQLGVDGRHNKFNPVVVQGPWVPFSSSADAMLDENSVVLRHIFVGGAQCFALVSESKVILCGSRPVLMFLSHPVYIYLHTMVALGSNFK